jgi:hypothetical protein
MHLAVVRWLANFDELVSYVGGSVILLAGLTKSNWSWGKARQRIVHHLLFSLFLPSFLYSSTFFYF